jgi:hypothetical protein
MTDDEALLAELGDALGAAREVPPAFIAAGQAALAWRTVDAELAELTHDSDPGASLAGTGAAEASLAGTRADPAALRYLSFSADHLSIEMEVAPEALLGQVVPPQSGHIEVQNPDGSARAVSVDEVGWFVIEPAPHTMFRMRLSASDGTVVITQWVTL